MPTTQYAQAHYQEVIDLHTESNSVSVVGFHTPVSDAPYNMLKGFFQQFRKYMYGGMKFSLVPVARLPADPLQVSYEAGDPTAQMDPRDLMNPIMFKGCHGDDMGTILNSMYGGVPGSGFGLDQSPSSDIVTGNATLFGDSNPWEWMYYAALTDNTWLKAHPQAGMRKSGLRPMVYSVGSMVPLGVGDNGQFGNPESAMDEGNGFAGMTPGTEIEELNPTPINGSYMPGMPDIRLNGTTQVNAGARYVTMPPFITPRLQRLGWMDTHTYMKSFPDGMTITGEVPDGVAGALTDAFQQSEVQIAKLPKVFMGMMMLPPAYTTEQYFRLVIDHTFHFKQFRGISNAEVEESANNQYWNRNL